MRKPANMKQIFAKFIHNASKQRYLDEYDMLNAQALLGGFNDRILDPKGSIPDALRDFVYRYRDGVENMAYQAIRVVDDGSEEGDKLVDTMLKGMRVALMGELESLRYLNALVLNSCANVLEGRQLERYRDRIEAEYREYGDRVTDTLWTLIKQADEHDLNAIKAVNSLASLAYAYWKTTRWKRLNGIDPSANDQRAFDLFDDIAGELEGIGEAIAEDELGEDSEWIPDGDDRSLDGMRAEYRARLSHGDAVLELGAEQERRLFPDTLSSALQALADAYSRGIPPIAPDILRRYGKDPARERPRRSPAE